MKKFLYFFALFWISMISLAVLVNFLREDELFPKVLGIKISGRAQLEEKEVIELIKPYISKNFGVVDTGRIREAILTHPYVRDATVKRVYPFYLHIQIEEKKPTALWIGKDGYPKVLDEEGNPFREIKRGESLDFLIIRAQELQEVKRMLMKAKSWEDSGLLPSKDVSEVLSENESVKVVLKSGVEILLGREEQDIRLSKALKVLNDAGKRGIAIKRMDARFEKGVIIKEGKY